MTVTIVGVIADELRAASELTTIAYAGPELRTFDSRRKYFSASSLQYRSIQPAEVRVDIDHDDRDVIGQVRYLELAPNNQLHAVAELDGRDLDGPLYRSPEIAHRDGRDIRLRAL